MRINETAFIIVSNIYVKQVEVLRIEGDFCLVTFDGKRLQLRKSRLYATEEEAYRHLPKKERLPAPDVGVPRKKEPSFYEQGI